VYGTIKNKIYLEHILKSYSKGRVKPKVKVILLMSIYQLLYMDKTPNFAIIDEAVKLSKKVAGNITGKFVNGILRNIERHASNLDLKYKNKTEQFCIENSLTNLEFSCGIPGSVGGAIFMNAGAYGGEMKEVVQKVEVFTKNGEKKIYTNEQMEFSYRHSVIQETKEIISRVYFQMKKGNKEEIISKVEELNKMRSDKQPLEYPSCGSVFKRPEGYFAGKLIQDAGLQGFQIGGAQVSKKHAGFMVNINSATCEDYKNLIKEVQKKVLEDSGVELECEVKILGE